MTKKILTDGITITMLDKLSDNVSSKGREQWNITGTVFFKGVKCSPQNLRVPPCSGPYPNYSVKIYPKGDNAAIVGQVNTDDKGEFKILLPAGEYVIYTQAGPSPSIVKATDFIIEVENNINLHLTVDTGVR
jgi:hypothetical protein